MGWWGFDVFGGDAPLDMIHIIEEAIGFDGIHPLADLPGVNCVVLSNKINSNWKQLRSAISREDGWNKRILIQVIATIILHVGGKFPQGFKRRAIASAFRDNMAMEDLQRRRVMDSMIEAILAYVGEPIRIDDDFTFDVDPDSVIYPEDSEGLFNLGGKKCGN